MIGVMARPGPGTSWPAPAKALPGPDDAAPETAEAAFRALFDAAYDDLTRFVERRTHPVDAPDVVAETFLVAWRRFDDVPRDPGEARAWLFVTARNLVANRVRRDRHQAAITVRIAAQPAPGVGEHDDVAARLDLARAFARLTPSDQEVIALTAWDGLSQAEAAAVLGIGARAYGVRLSRARRRLRTHLSTGAAAPLTQEGPRA